MGQLGVHGSLQHSLHEPLQQSVFADDIFRLLIILQELVVLLIDIGGRLHKKFSPQQLGYKLVPIEEKPAA